MKCVIALAFNVDGILIIENELNTFLASLHYANEFKVAHNCGLLLARV
jgi:hypothetical protein